MAQLFRGSATKAVAPLERGLSLSPYDPQNFAWYNLLALAHVFAGAPEQALAARLPGMGQIFACPAQAGQGKCSSVSGHWAQTKPEMGKPLAALLESWIT
jgi:hypothetical protein